MREIPHSQKPSFRSIILAVLLVGIYLYNLIWNGGVWQNVLGIAFDLILLALIFQLWIFFYAQFTLPIHTLDDRKKVASRLRLHAKHSHGPAIFVKNGRKIEREGESSNHGPGLLWLDTASAVVTRSFAAFDRVLGPGIHFTGDGEQIASTISLHTQTQMIGPLAGDAPFRKLSGDASEEERGRFEASNNRCMAVRGMTHDGIEVIPSISVTFKIDAKPAGPGEMGSRFGFASESVDKAARSEGINPNSSSEEKRRVAWNQLPALIASDLWREYLSKFTLDELFKSDLPKLPAIPQPQPSLSTIRQTPAQLQKKSSFAEQFLQKINNSLESNLKSSFPSGGAATEKVTASAIPSYKHEPTPSETRTALQIITQMMNARMSQLVVAKLDECGRLLEGSEISSEYKKLQDRGIAVLGVWVTSLYLNEAVESQLVSRWTTNWLSHAKTDRSRVERLSLAYGEQARQEAVLDHSLALSRSLVEEKPANLLDAVKTLLQRTQNEIKLNDRILSRMDGEFGALDAMVKWVDEKEL